MHINDNNNNNIDKKKSNRRSTFMCYLKCHSAKIFYPSNSFVFLKKRKGEFFQKSLGCRFITVNNNVNLSIDRFLQASCFFKNLRPFIYDYSAHVIYMHFRYI